MRDKRIAKRVMQENKVTIKVVSEFGQSSARKVTYNLTRDISATGAKLRSNNFLPKEALLKIELRLKDPPRMVKVFGRVQWVKSLYGGETFELGVKFVDTARDSIRMLAEHIASMENTQP